jgi:serine/threonine protein kinase
MSDGTTCTLVPALRFLWSVFGDQVAQLPFAFWPLSDVEDAERETFRDLVLKLTNFDPTKRLTAAQALQHDFFKDLGDI